MLFIQRICRFLPPHCPRSVQHLSIFSGTITLEMWKQKANRIIWKIKRNNLKKHWKSKNLPKGINLKINYKMAPYGVKQSNW